VCPITVLAATVTRLVKVDHQDKIIKNYAQNKILCNVLLDMGHTQKIWDLGIQVQGCLIEIINQGNKLI